MAPPIIIVNTKWNKILRLVALCYFLWQLRKFIKKLRALADPKHSNQRYRNPLAQPSTALFPQFFESDTTGLWVFHRDWVLPNYFQWKIPKDLNKPKGVIIISHGLAEHIQRYEHLAQQLNKEGYAVYGMDHQGHGLSDGNRCYVEKFSNYIDDLLLFSQGVVDQYDEYQIPTYLFGHSMGGLIAAYTALKSQNISKKNKQKSYLFDGGVILSSPFFGVAPEADIGSQYTIIEKSLRFLSKQFPKFKCIALNNKGLSHDPKILYRLQRDPLHYTDMLPIRTIQELIDAATNMLKIECGNIEYDYLLFGGKDDPLCNANKWKTFHDNTKSNDKELVIFEGLYHECLNETEAHQKKVCKRIIDWIEQRRQIHEYNNNNNNNRNIHNSIDIDIDDDNNSDD